MGDQSFGGYLGELLGNKMTAYQLAKAIGVAPAIVYRWVSEKEVPSLSRASTIDHIADKLGLDETQRQRLKDLQVASLKKRAAEASSHDRKTYTKSVMTNRAEALEAAIKLLEDCAKVPGQTNKPISSTLQGRTIFKIADLDIDFHFHDRWNRARQAALKNGWSIRQYYRLNDDILRSMDLVTDLLDMVAAGDYKPFFFPDGKGLYEPPYELLLIPNQVALLFFATEDMEAVDAAVRIDTPAYLTVLERHLQLLADQTQQLFIPYVSDGDIAAPLAERKRFMEEIGVQEDQPGSRFLCKSDFASITRPTSYYRPGSPWVAQGKLEGWEPKALQEHYEARLKAVRRKRHDHYRDMYSKRSIANLVATGHYSSYRSIVTDVREKPESVRDHLENVVSILNAHENYEIALLNDKEEDELRLKLFWEVVGESGQERVFIEKWYPDGSKGRQVVDLRVREQRIVRAFKQYFESFWEHLSPESKDKREVIKWLEQQIRNIDQEVGRHA